MATRNIQMNYYNGGSYDQLYPQVKLTNIIGVLPVANGGTGTTSLSSLQSSMGISNVGLYNWTDGYSFFHSGRGITTLNFANRNINLLEVDVIYINISNLAWTGQATRYSTYSIKPEFSKSVNNKITGDITSDLGRISGGISNSSIFMSINYNDYFLYKFYSLSYTVDTSYDKSIAKLANFYFAGVNNRYLDIDFADTSLTDNPTIRYMPDINFYFDLGDSTPSTTINSCTLTFRFGKKKW